MTPEQLSDSIDEIVGTVDQRFGRQVAKTNKALFDQLQLLLKRLELKPDGTIKQSQANRKILAKANGYFEKAFSESGYYKSLNKVAGSLIKITDANAAYFTFIQDVFSRDAQYLKSLQKQTISQLESLLANEGLELSLKQPILNILNQNINSGASFADVTKQINEFILGSDKIEPTLSRYSKQVTSDTLFNYSRAYQESVSQNSGNEWYRYSGGTVEDSRDFCISRSGKFFHKSEIENWASLSWQGKRKGTTSSTIFIYCGGYSCRHSLIPVSESIVPRKALDRIGG